LAVKRVGLFRALLLAHVQMMVNRTRKGLGRRGLVGVVVIVLVLLAGAAPIFAAFGFLGYLFGHRVEKPLAAPIMGLVLTVSTLAFGVVGGMLGGARQLTWDAYRSFPIPFRTLFFAETVASLGDMVVLGFVGMTLTMGLAFVWQWPASAPFIALLMTELVLCVLFIQHLVGTLAVTAVRRLRRAMVVILVASWVGVSVVAEAARQVRDRLQGDEVDRLQELWRHARPAIDLLPPVLAVRAMVVLKHGAIVRALRLEAPMLATTILLGSLSYLVLSRESRPRKGSDRVTSRAHGRFRGRGTTAPYWLLAQVHLHHVAGSLQGRFGLVVPLITVVLIKGPLASAGIGSDFTLPGSVIYLALAATQFHFNQFGLDGHGVKTMFLLPVRMRDILLGKTIALFAYSVLQNVFLLALLGFILRPSAREIVSAALLAATLAVAHSLEGHWISAIFPRPLAMHRMNSTGLSGANLLPLGAGIINGSVFGGIYALASWLAPGARIMVLAALLLLVLAAYRLLLPRAARFVESRRETVVEVLA
jgi:hypothetical protein